MSMLLMVAAMKSKIGNPIRKLVLIKLADNANDEGVCWPSYRHIADHCEIDRKTAMRHIQWLEDNKFLSKTYRKDDERGNKSNVYRVDIASGIEHIGAQNDQPSTTESLPPSPTESPRTSHSLEPIIEPVINIVHSDESTALDDCFELFWKSGMKKLNKKKALSAFRTAFKNAKPKLMTDNKEAEFAAYLVRDVQKRIKNKQFGFDRLHPVTYLNGERWHDEYTNADGKSVRVKSDFPEQQGADRPIHVVEARATLTADDREQLKNQRGKLAELMGNL